MSFERRIAVVAGLATIASALMYAVDNDWFAGVPDLRVASKTVELSSPPLPEAKTPENNVTLRPAISPKSRSPKRTKRRVAKRSKARGTPRTRTVSIFKVAKDIPHPNTQR